MQNNGQQAQEQTSKRPRTIDVYQVLIECRNEDEQRELFERLRKEGRKVRLLVL